MKTSDKNDIDTKNQEIKETDIKDPKINLNKELNIYKHIYNTFYDKINSQENEHLNKNAYIICNAISFALEILEEKNITPEKIKKYDLNGKILLLLNNLKTQEKEYPDKLIIMKTLSDIQRFNIKDYDKIFNYIKETL
jgi:hypothetical protein